MHYCVIKFPLSDSDEMPKAAEIVFANKTETPLPHSKEVAYKLKGTGNWFPPIR